MLCLPLKAVPKSSAKADNEKKGSAARREKKEKRAGNSASYRLAKPASRKNFDPCLELTFEFAFRVVISSDLMIQPFVAWLKSFLNGISIQPTISFLK